MPELAPLELLKPEPVEPVLGAPVPEPEGLLVLELPKPEPDELEPELLKLEPEPVLGALLLEPVDLLEPELLKPELPELPERPPLENELELREPPPPPPPDLARTSKQGARASRQETSKIIRRFCMMFSPINKP